jgi:hypothetical protein
MKRPVALATIALALTGCVADAADDDDDETGAAEGAVTYETGINGSVCYLSGYNCKLRPHGGNRVSHVNGNLDWAVDQDVEVLDGNGDPLGLNHSATLKFNYGQERMFGGKPYVFAMTTSNKSSGWFPLSAVHSGTALAARLGHVSAHRSGLTKMACYEIKNSSDPELEKKKVVYDTSAAPGPSGEAAGDYLSKLRANGKRSANLIFNLPGSGLGGPAIDHFPAGTKFQRVAVKTDNGGPPSLDVKLWLQDGSGHFKKPAGTMKFIYGYVVSKTGDTRVGWMAYDALTPSTGCP